MAILREHVPWYKEIFALPELLVEPILVFGFQEVCINRMYFEPWHHMSLGRKLMKIRLSLQERRMVRAGRAHPDLHIPQAYGVANLSQLLHNHGAREIQVLDLFDARADLRYDMNLRVPPKETGRYGTVIDIGCLEHVFDTRQCLENCLSMVRVGGVYVLHTPVKGYYSHGLHTFNPDALLQALTLNGFELVYQRYSTDGGVPLDDPAKGENVLIWLVGRKVADVSVFRYPLQGGWDELYGRYKAEPHGIASERDS
jgi:hypothetical protein